MKMRTTLINNLIIQTVKKLCECGCRKELKNIHKRFIWGHHNRNKIIQEKKKQTLLKNYGVEHPYQSKIIQERGIQTSQKHYGIDNPNQSKKVQEKRKQTCLEKFGETTNLKCKETKDKIKQTCLKKYGVENPNQSQKIKEKYKETCIKHFGVDNYSKTFEFRNFSRKKLIEDITSGLKDGERFSPRKGKNEKPFISELQKYTPFFIDNDAKIINYFPDGYIKEVGIIIEFDEFHHERIWSQNHDQKKDADYQKSGLTVFRVKEKDWKRKPDEIINQFQLLQENLNG